jgi:hypothetical protein
MNDSKTMSKIFTADQPQNTNDSIKVLALSVPPNSDKVFAFPVFSKILVYFEPFFRVKNGSQTSEPVK